MTEEIKGGVTLFADLAGSTSLYESLGDVAASLAVRAQLEQISTRIRENDGRVIKTIGDAVHAWLPGADSAANAAIAIQRTCHGTLPVRVGFHYGAALFVRKQVPFDGLRERIDDQILVRKIPVRFFRGAVGVVLRRARHAEKSM